MPNLTTLHIDLRAPIHKFSVHEVGYIAKRLTKLERLEISTEDWSPLKSLTSLSSLIIISNNSSLIASLMDIKSLDECIAKQLSANPRQVGLNLVIFQSSRQTRYNLLCEAAKSGNQQLVDQIINKGASYYTQLGIKGPSLASSLISSAKFVSKFSCLFS